MNRELTSALAGWVAEGRARIGQIAIREFGGAFELRHIDDVACADLAMYDGADAARGLANLDEAGAFRPLKTAPTLRRGWRLTLRDAAQLRRALDYFYPAMCGVWRSHERGGLRAVPLRETLGRQTGMYRVTQNITDSEAQALVDGFCAGCLKCRLWDGQTPSGSDHIPMLCHEACNLLVAEARKVVKNRRPHDS